jgi:hypothetical protein
MQCSLPKTKAWLAKTEVQPKNPKPDGYPTRSFACVGAGFYFNPWVTRTRSKNWFILYFVQKKIKIQ